jgi:hypothetical protein
MIPKKITKLTIPLFPYLRPGERKPRKTKRIRPLDALNLKKMMREIRKSEVMTIDAAGRPWSLTSVYSSYSPDIHVMLIDSSPGRYVPGPEKIPDRQGDSLMKLWAAVLDSIAQRKTVATVHAGYNWSPRAWGAEEEKTGFQSVPTKWHPHLWGWPAFEKMPSTKEWSAKSVNVLLLPFPVRRMLGDNNYAKPFGLLIKDRMREKFPKGTLFNKLFPHRKWFIDGRGVYTRFNLSVPEILRTPGFFEQILKPLAAMLEQITRELTETFTTINCIDLDRILLETQKGVPKNWRLLRATPVMRDEKHIRRTFKLRGYSAGLFEALWQPVWNRCHEKGTHANWWRKGFAYALVFHGPARASRGELRIMPGVFIGPGGVVEAENFIIARPENRTFSPDQIRRKSEDLRKLADDLKKFGLHG